MGRLSLLRRRWEWERGTKEKSERTAARPVSGRTGLLCACWSGAYGDLGPWEWLAAAVAEAPLLPDGVAAHRAEGTVGLLGFGLLGWRRDGPALCTGAGWTSDQGAGQSDEETHAAVGARLNGSRLPPLLEEGAEVSALDAERDGEVRDGRGEPSAGLVAALQDGLEHGFLILHLGKTPPGMRMALFCVNRQKRTTERKGGWRRKDVARKVGSTAFIGMACRLSGGRSG